LRAWNGERSPSPSPWEYEIVPEQKPPILIVDFQHGGRRGTVGTVLLSRKGGKPVDLKKHIQNVLDLQHATLRDGLKVWLVDLDGDISGRDGAPLAATVLWHGVSGWIAEYVWSDAESG
jgi:hypothetical protein